MPRNRLLIALLGTCLTLAAHAQQSEESATESAQSAVTEADNSGSDSAATQAPAATEAPPAKETPAATASTQPPDEYRASEQISDDLSVSFPVDI